MKKRAKKEGIGKTEFGVRKGSEGGEEGEIAEKKNKVITTL